MFFDDIKNFKSNDICNVVSLNGGKYYFETEEIYNNFLTMLSNDMMNETTLHHFAEKTKNIKTPLHFDFDFLFLFQRDFQRQIKYDFIEGLIQRLYTILDTIIDIDNEKCFVFMKDKCKRKENDIKDGIHIMFPELICSIEYVKEIRNKFLEKYSTYLTSLNGLSELNPKKIFDNAAITNPWLLFHNTKKDDLQYYKIHCILDKDLVEYPIENYQIPTFENLKYFSLLFKEQYECSYKYDIINITTCSTSNSNSNSNRTVIHSKITHPFINLEFLEKLLYLYNEERYNDYDKWIQIIWGLHNICIQHNFSESECIEKLIKWSKQSTKYKEGDVEKIYYNAKENGIFLGSLIMWGKEDNYNETIKLIEEYNINEIKKLTSKVKASHYDIAKVLSCFLKDEFVYSGKKNDQKQFYKFDLYRWVECDDIQIKSLITKLLIPPLHNINTEYLSLRNIAVENQESIADHYTLLCNNISKLILNLGTDSFKNSVLNQLKELLLDFDFYNKIDTNPIYVGLKNGIYNLETNTFRNCNPDDYISMSMNAKYIETYKSVDIFFNSSFEDIKLNIDKEMCLELMKYPIEYINYLNTIEFDFDTYEEQECFEQLQKLYTFFGQLFVNYDEKEYVLRVLSTFLEGRNKLEKFYIGYGCGSNGKSKLTKLLQYTFGDYYAPFDVKVLTSGRSKPGNATPEFMCLRNKRVAIVTEPSRGDILNDGLLKQLTGNDEIQARGLYGKLENFTLMCNFLMTANTLPEIKNPDGGIERRISLINFDSHFTYNPDPSIKTEFLRDDNIEHMLPELVDTFFYVLLHYYNILQYKENGRLYCPEQFEKEKTKYISEQDIITDYLDRCLIQSPNDKISLQDIYKGFTHYKKNYNNDSHFKISMKELETLMMKNHVKYKHRQYQKERNHYYLLDYKLELSD